MLKTHRRVCQVDTGERRKGKLSIATSCASVNITTLLLLKKSGFCHISKHFPSSGSLLTLRPRCSGRVEITPQRREVYNGRSCWTTSFNSSTIKQLLFYFKCFPTSVTELRVVVCCILVVLNFFFFNYTKGKFVAWHFICSKFLSLMSFTKVELFCIYIRDTQNANAKYFYHRFGPNKINHSIVLLRRQWWLCTGIILLSFFLLSFLNLYLQTWFLKFNECTFYKCI